MTPEEAAFCADLRMHVLANKQQGLPAHAGLDRDKVKACLDLSRKDYTTNQAKSTAAGVSSPSTAAAMDLGSLFMTGKAK